MILHDLMEATKQEVAIIFGRFNPPHKGHKAAWEMAAQSPTWYVGTNKSTQGPKDPLPFDAKIKAMSAIWPEVAGHIVAEQSWLTLASKVYAQHGDVKLVVLTDEEWVGKTIKQYNGVESAHGIYKFSDIEVKPTPRLSSATALRDAVIKGDRKAFADAAGVPADTRIDGVPFFDLVAQYLLPYQAQVKPKKKTKEGVEPDPQGYQKDILASPKYTLVIDTPSDLDWYKIGQHFPNLGTEDPHEYGQSDTDMTITTANRQELEDLKAKLARLGLKFKEIGGTFDQPEIHSETIRKVKGGYRLVSKKGNKNLGTYPTKAGAEKRERQVQYFKHMGESTDAPAPKVTLYTDPSYYGADVAKDAGQGLKVNQIPLVQLVGFEPDEKMKDPKSSANMRKMVDLIKSGKAQDLPPILVRKYKNGFQVLDGHHRFHAYKAAGAKTIPGKIIPDSDIKIVDHANESLEESLHPTKIALPDGRLYISDHFWDRMREYDLDMKNVANTITKGFKQYGNAIRAIKDDDFIIMDRRRTGIAIRKTERPSGDSIYVLGTIHPTLRVGGGQQVYMVESDDLNVQFHDELNPAIWKAGKMRADVRANLMKIAQDFQKSLGIKLDGLKDITVSGSNAAYSYTPKSDVDLHLVADIPEADEDNIYRELFDAKKYQYNTEHDYKIRGYDVELYVQNANQPHVSQGIYSVMRDEWIKEPQRVTGGYDHEATRQKYDNLRDLINQAIKTRDYFLADKLRATIKKYRQVGLHATGEFGPENLAFKAIRANGYLNKLYDLLNDIKDDELSIPEHALTEIDMSPGSLKKFASTPVAQAMTVGFEAEMVIPGLAGGDPDDYDSEPDMDMDDYVDTSSVARLTRGLEGFFRDTASSRSIERAVEEVNDEIMEYMDNQFLEYIDNNISDVEAQYKNDTELSDEEIEASIQKQDKDYDGIIETMREDFYSSWDDLEGALENLGLQMYSDWDNRFGWGWPYFTEPDYGNADVDGDDLAKQWSAWTGYKAKASSGYHSADREPGTWIFEPDSSIQADSGMGGIEMVSPPMPLAQGMKALEEFFSWAGEIGADANRSTGFHMGVSIPDQTYDNIDHLKLILLLGDQNVLARFNRSANQYTKSILEKIKGNLRKVDLDKAFDTMRKGMQLIASEAVGDEIIGRQDRYVSVNIKDNYIEFRSAGGSYFDKKDELRNVMLRYVRVMASAADPEADKQEYAKKLYKLLSTITGDETNTIKAFAAYTAGTITRSELVGMLKQAQVARIQKKAGPEEWYGLDRNSEPVVTVNAKNEQEALKLAFAWEKNNPIFGGIRGVIRVSERPGVSVPAQAQDEPTQLYGVYVMNNDGRNVEQTRIRARNSQEASALAFRWGRDNNRVVTGIDLIESARSINESKSSMTGREMMHYYEQCHHADIKNAKMRMYLMENDWVLGTCEAKDLPNAREFKDDAFGRDMKLDMEQVQHYMEALAEGEEFMPIIMGPNKSIIDGNHRAQAARKLNRVIECYWAR